MFFLRFLGSKFLVNLLLQFRERKIFCTQVFVGLQSFHFVFKVIVSKILKLYSRLLFH